MELRLREYENFHIVLWILKDTCWLMEWKTAGIMMIVPTVAAAFHITWLGRKNIADLYHNLAVSNWICANAVWMIGEFFFDDTFRPFSSVFFDIGLVFLAAYYFGILPQEKLRNRKTPIMQKTNLRKVGHKKLKPRKTRKTRKARKFFGRG